MDNKFEGTRVDLGEDLLEPSKGSDQPDSKQSAESKIQESATDLYRSAEILIAEGLAEDAKKTLRKIMIHFPNFGAAKKKLEEIQESEIKKIFQESVPRKSFQGNPNQEFESALRLTRDEILEQLEKDLKLVRPNVKSEFDLDEDYFGFYESLLKSNPNLSTQDHIDVGIAFYEMGLFGLACKQFEKTIQSAEAAIESAAWFGQALLMAGKPFEVVLALEPFVQDNRIPEIQRVALVYIIARAFESLGQLDKAHFFFQISDTWSPDYRDSRDRMHSIEERLKQK